MLECGLLTRSNGSNPIDICIVSIKYAESWENSNKNRDDEFVFVYLTNTNAFNDYDEFHVIHFY